MTMEVALASDPKDDHLALIEKVELWLGAQPSGDCWTLRDFTRSGPYCVRDIGNDRRLKVLDELVSRGSLDVVDVKPAGVGRPTKRWLKA